MNNPFNNPLGNPMNIVTNPFRVFQPNQGLNNNQNKKQTCTYCGGKGVHSEIGEDSCHDCCGTGRNTLSEFFHEPCRVCNGKGRRPFCRRVKCSLCDGTGKK
jgi:DnaJ-class molecular chaperone